MFKNKKHKLPINDKTLPSSSWMFQQILPKQEWINPRLLLYDHHHELLIPISLLIVLITFIIYWIPNRRTKHHPHPPHQQRGETSNCTTTRAQRSNLSLRQQGAIPSTPSSHPPPSQRGKKSQLKMFSSAWKQVQQTSAKTQDKLRTKWKTHQQQQQQQRQQQQQQQEHQVPPPLSPTSTTSSTTMSASFSPGVVAHSAATAMPHSSSSGNDTTKYAQIVSAPRPPTLLPQQPPQQQHPKSQYARVVSAPRPPPAPPAAATAPPVRVAQVTSTPRPPPTATTSTPHAQVASSPRPPPAAGAAVPAAPAVKYVQLHAGTGSGCCRLCGKYVTGKKVCKNCGCKYCPTCSYVAIVEEGRRCVGCKLVVETESIRNVTHRGKSSCRHCQQEAMNKRSCIHCYAKYCETCCNEVLLASTCIHCHPQEEVPQVELYTETICATCYKQPGKDKLRCLVCGKQCCKICHEIAYGADKPEGYKCQHTCVGKVPHQLLIPKPAIDWSIKTSCLSSTIRVNGMPLDGIQKWILLCEGAYYTTNHGSQIDWWYDTRSGWFGRYGEGPSFRIHANLKLGGKVLDSNCSHGTTGISLNGRQIVTNEQYKLTMASVQLPPGDYFFEYNGDYGPNFGPDKGRILGNFRNKAKRNAAIGAGLLLVGFTLTGGEETLLSGGGDEIRTDSGVVGTLSDGRSYFTAADGTSVAC